MIEELLQEFKQKTDREIILYFDNKISQYRQVFPQSILLIEQIKDLILRGGDRVRPALFYYGFIAIRKPSADEEKELIRVSTAFELFHTFALIHDDIIDGSKKRRGGLAVHEFFEKKFKGKWGEKLALLAGDLAEIFSQDIFSSQYFSKQYHQARNWFVLMKEKTIIGEYMDTLYPLLSDVPVTGKIWQMYGLKTCFYSVSAPLVIGALLAGASKKQVDSLLQFGQKAGLAFQIQDDILGMFGDDRTTGKSNISDIVEGKRTPLIAYALDFLANSSTKGKFLRAFLSKKKTVADIHFIKSTIQETGALDTCRKDCIQLISDAKKIIRVEKLSKETHYFLYQLSDFFIERNY